MGLLLLLFVYNNCIEGVWGSHETYYTSLVLVVFFSISLFSSPCKRQYRNRTRETGSTGKQDWIIQRRVDGEVVLSAAAIVALIARTKRNVPGLRAGGGEARGMLNLLLFSYSHEMLPFFAK